MAGRARRRDRRQPLFRPRASPASAVARPLRRSRSRLRRRPPRRASLDLRARYGRPLADLRQRRPRPPLRAVRAGVCKSVVISAGGDLKPLVSTGSSYAINQAVFAGDAARPPAGEVASERFRLTDAFERIATRVFDERVNSSNRIPVRLLPVAIVFPCATGPKQPHFRRLDFFARVGGSASACSARRPAAAS